MKSRDITSGLLCTAIGLAFAIYAYTDLNMGTIRQMGPGYFPFMLGCLLMILGLIIAGQPLKNAVASAPIPWRGALFMLAAPVAFALTLEPLGFAAAVFLVALLASFASASMKVGTALLCSIGLAIICILIFSTALGLPVSLLGAWFS